jgi:hypothetical protein
MAPMQYFEKAQSSFKPPLVANENAFLGDIMATFVPPYTIPLPRNL